MALCARLCRKSFLGLHGVRSISITPYVSCCPKVVLQPKGYESPQQAGHDERNMNLGRPLSPHLTIYKFQLTAVLSITHRFTGIALSAYISGLGLTALMVNRPMTEVIMNISQNYPTLFILAKLGLIFPFTYHFFNGIRHLIWDSGKSLSIKGVYSSGYLMLASAGITAAAFYFI